MRFTCMAASPSWMFLDHGGDRRLPDVLLPAGRAVRDMTLGVSQFDMPFGMLMRNMHRWAAHGMADRGLAAHVPRVPSPFVQASPGVQLGGRRHPCSCSRCSASPLTAAVGPARDSGGDRRLEHGACDAAARSRGRRGVRRRNACNVRAFLFRRRRESVRTRCCGSTSALRVIPAGHEPFPAVHFWRIRRDGGSCPAL